MFGLICSHVNRKTQFENPVQARRRQSHSSNMSYSTVPPPHEGPPSFQSAAALAKAQEAEAHSRSVWSISPCSISIGCTLLSKQVIRKTTTVETT